MPLHPPSTNTTIGTFFLHIFSDETSLDSAFIKLLPYKELINLGDATDLINEMIAEGLLTPIMCYFPSTKKEEENIKTNCMLMDYRLTFKGRWRLFCKELKW
jgi:hypothetical protein